MNIGKKIGFIHVLSLRAMVLATHYTVFLFVAHALTLANLPLKIKFFLETCLNHILMQDIVLCISLLAMGGGVILIVFYVIWAYMKSLMKMRSKHATPKPNPAHGEYLMNLCSDMQKAS